MAELFVASKGKTYKVQLPTIRVHMNKYMDVYLAAWIKEDFSVQMLACDPDHVVMRSFHASDQDADIESFWESGYRPGTYEDFDLVQRHVLGRMIELTCRNNKP